MDGNPLSKVPGSGGPGFGLAPEGEVYMACLHDDRNDGMMDYWGSERNKGMPQGYGLFHLLSNRFLRLETHPLPTYSPLGDAQNDHNSK